MIKAIRISKNYVVSEYEYLKFIEQMTDKDLLKMLGLYDRTITLTLEDEIAIIQTTSQVTTEGGRGSLKINLKWNTYDDLDLHVIDPDNVEIYYRNKASECQGIIGLLDVDANASNLTKVPQENIFWEEGKNAPLGRYKVFVEYFAKKDDVEEVPFTVTIYPQRGISKVFTKKVRNVKERLDIVEFDYTENGISYITAY